MPGRLQSFRLPSVLQCVIRLPCGIWATSLKSTAGVTQQPIPLFSISFSRPAGRDQNFLERSARRGKEKERETHRQKEGGGSLAFRFCPCPCSAFWGQESQFRTMGKKMVPNEPLNGNTVGGSASFKALPGHIVLPDRRRRMEFAGGCQKVSSLCERTSPLFTALYRTQVLLPSFVLLPLPSHSLAPPAFFSSLGRSGSALDVPLSPYTTHPKVSN